MRILQRHGHLMLRWGPWWGPSSCASAGWHLCLQGHCEGQGLRFGGADKCCLTGGSSLSLLCLCQPWRGLPSVTLSWAPRVALVVCRPDCPRALLPVRELVWVVVEMLPHRGIPPRAESTSVPG